MTGYSLVIGEQEPTTQSTPAIVNRCYSALSEPAIQSVQISVPAFHHQTRTVPIWASEFSSRFGCTTVPVQPALLLAALLCPRPQSGGDSSPSPAEEV